MQESIVNAPHWLQLVLAALASLIARDGIVKLYHVWLNRNKPAVEIHRTREEATEIQVRSSSAAGDAVIRFMDRLTVAQETIDRLRNERDEWELKSFDLQVKLKEVQTEFNQLAVQAKLDNYQIRKQMGFIEMKNLKEEYLQLDAPKEE